MSSSATKKNISFYNILGKIGDILLWPVLIISLLSSFFMLAQRGKNKVTSIFNISLVNILSGSMVNDGFNKGDIVITKRVNEKNVALGDVIAFYDLTCSFQEKDLNLIIKYDYTNGLYLNTSEENIINTTINIKDIVKVNNQRKEFIKEAQKKDAKVNFHKVIAIYYDNEGNIFYKTKGSNNTSADSNLVRGDLLVGKYVYTPTIFRKIVHFCASSLGMILLVCLPLSVLVLMELLSLIEQISVMSIEKKLITGKVSVYDKELQKSLNYDQIELYNKIYYFYVIDEEDKQEAIKYMWTQEFNKSNENKLYNVFKISEDKLISGDEAGYWNTWIDYCNKNNKKQLIKLRNQFLIDNVKDENRDSIKNINKIYRENKQKNNI